jgi:hypothetical protein
MKEDCKEGTLRRYRYMEKFGCYTLHIKVKPYLIVIMMMMMTTMMMMMIIIIIIAMNIGD